MLKSFINAKTHEKIRLDIEWEVTKEKLESSLWVEVRGNLPIEDMPTEQAAPKKRGRPKKEVLDANEEE